ncbi:MAG TPA: DUF2306 domain-containing protein [Caulobacteraceae bacterium]|jgi:uncharacterized membrane protein
MTPMRKVWWTLAALFCVGLAIYSYRYFAPPASNILGNTLARPWLWLHIAGAATALLLSPVQLLPWIRRRFPQVHRITGRVYVIGCLAGGVGGFVAAFGSTAGPIATAGFALLAPTWIFVNIQGWRAAVGRRFQDHRRWMLRSFSLTFAAVTLRLYLPIGMVAGLSFVEIYRATAWISWIPNLILMELYLRGAFRSRTPIAAAA